MADAHISYSFEIVTPIDVFARQIKKALYDIISPKILGGLKGLEKQIQDIVSAHIRKTAIYDNLLRDRIRFELGIPELRSLVDRVVEKYVDNIEVTGSVSPKIDGTTLIVVFKRENIIQELTQHPDSFLVTNRGQALPWLEWILLKGSEDVVLGYDFLLGEFGDRSRTGGGIMVKQNVGNWSVPTSVQGTEGTNFLSLGFTNSIAQIEGLLLGFITSTIEK